MSCDQSGRLINGIQSNTYDSFENVIGGPQESPGDGESGYTELLQGSVPCPTCRGLGNVPKEQEGQLIALIPMKDKRLKPRRTYLWVCLAVFLCIIVAGLIIFFMFPRSVNIESTHPYLKPEGPVYVNVTDSLVKFSVVNRINITNQNYFSLKVTSVKMTVLYDTQVLSDFTNTTKLEVGMRSHGEYYVKIDIQLNKENEMGYMANSCLNPIRWAHELVMLFEFTCNYEYLGHSEQNTLQTFQFVSCYSKEKPTTVAPKTTTTTKSTTTKLISATANLHSNR